MLNTSLLCFIMCVFDITSLILKKRIFFLLIIIIFLSYIEGEIFFHGLAFHSLCIHNFDHVYVSLIFLVLTSVLLPFVHSRKKKGEKTLESADWLTRNR